MDDMRPQVTCRDEPVLPPLPLDGKIPSLRLRRTQVVWHHGELPELRKLGVRIKYCREWTASRIPSPWIVKPRIVPDDVQTPRRRNGCPQVRLPVDVIVSNAGRRPDRRTAISI